VGAGYSLGREGLGGRDSKGYVDVEALRRGKTIDNAHPTPCGGGFQAEGAAAQENCKVDFCKPLPGLGA